MMLSKNEFIVFLLALVLPLPFLTIATAQTLAPNLSTNTTAPIIKLDYITLKGAYSDTYNLTHYRRIPFAASTAGRNRFRAPQPPPPLPEDRYGIYDTDRDFSMCPQRTVNGSEDCLYLGIYSRPWNTQAYSHAKKNVTLRPVLLTFYGGGFIRGSATFSIPPSGFPVLNASTLNDYVVVYSNYRTNVFGFLAGERVAKSPDMDLNVGLRDSRAALEWIQKYIGHFGGDAGNMTIWGQSAGGGSVVGQVVAGARWKSETGRRTGTKEVGSETRKGNKLFHKAMATSPFWPKTPAFNSPYSERLYSRVVQETGCANPDADEEIACLKTVDVQKLREVSLGMENWHQYTESTFTWGPVVDGDFIAKPLSYIVKSGKLDVGAVLTSYNLHEGENFVPPGFTSPISNTTTGADGFNSSSASFNNWLRGFLPYFSDDEIAAVEDIYPANGEAEELKWNTTYERAGMVYRDLILACPALWLADTAPARKGWLVEYTIDPAKHASDTVYVSDFISSPFCCQSESR